MTRIEQVLAFFERHRGSHNIKLITGMRGCGKSRVLELWCARLKAEGVRDDHIVRIDLEDPLNQRLHATEALLDAVESRLPADEERVHVLLDEICECDEFEAVIGVLHARSRIDLTLTCSNQRPISDRFREYLSGRCFHMEMLPPAFAEVPLAKRCSFQSRLDHVVKFGTLPYLDPYRSYRNFPELVRVYDTGLWNTILVKDILSRNRLADSRLTEKLLARLYAHLGENESLRKIVADSAIQGREAAPNTVASYIDALDESLLVRKLPKFDAFSGETLKAGYRFYMTDISLGMVRYGVPPAEADNVIRNLIAVELAGRGGRLFCGRYDGSDFDFVLIRKNRYSCWQYAPEIVDGAVPTPVLAPLKRISDEVPKTVIVRGALPRRRAKGIEYVTLEQFLKNQSEGGES